MGLEIRREVRTVQAGVVKLVSEATLKGKSNSRISAIEYLANLAEVHLQWPETVYTYLELLALW